MRSIILVDAVAMILRVWALYNRSKLILAILLTLYAIQLIIYATFCVILSTQSESTGM